MKPLLPKLPVQFLALTAVTTAFAIGCNYKSVNVKPVAQPNKKSAESALRDQRCPNELPKDAPSDVDPKVLRRVTPIGLLDGQPGVYRLKQAEIYLSSESDDGKQASGQMVRFERGGNLAQWDDRGNTLATTCNYPSSGLGLATSIPLPLSIDHETGLIIDGADIYLGASPRSNIQTSLGQLDEISNADSDNFRWVMKPAISKEGGLALRIDLWRKEKNRKVLITAFAQYEAEKPQPDETRAEELFARLLDQKNEKQLYAKAEDSGAQVKRFKKIGISFAKFHSTLDFFRSLRDPSLNGHVFPGRRAVEITFAALEDKNFELEKLRGKLAPRNFGEGRDKAPATVADALKKAFSDANIDVDVDGLLKGEI